jgi:hypothetical protein
VAQRSFMYHSKPDLFAAIRSFYLTAIEMTPAYVR